MSTVVQLLVLLTAMTLFNVAALLLHPGHVALKVVLAALMFAPLFSWAWLSARSRRRGQTDARVLSAAVLGSILVQNAARPILDLSEGRRLNPFDKALLALTAVFLVGLLVSQLGRLWKQRT